MQTFNTACKKLHLFVLLQDLYMRGYCGLYPDNMYDGDRTVHSPSATLY